MLLPIAALAFPLVAPPQAPAVVIAHDDNGHARPGFRFADATVPMPARSDAAAGARFTLVDGRADRNSPPLDVLHDGRLPSGADQPVANFFFARDGGRFAVDLGSVQDVAAVDSYSWHPGSRAPQVYRLYAADGEAAGFDPAPTRERDPAQCGWRLVADVDTRPADALAVGGQYGVQITGALGRLRHLLFDVSPTAADDRGSNTFFSEVDVRVAGEAPAPRLDGTTADGRFAIHVDVAEAPDLQAWADDELMPVLLDWYPRIVDLLPSDGFAPPPQVEVLFEDPGRGIAATGGARVTCAAAWFRQNLRGEAIGAVVHELVHVAQNYPRSNRESRPGWLVEGIADYVRWFLYEPGSHGADMVPDPAKASCRAGYRVSANFLAWASRRHGKDLVAKLNAALRAGTYDDALWQELTGSTLGQLEAEWRQALTPPPGVDVLTDEERQAGWRLLFDGQGFRGWHSFHADGVRPGWVVEAGVITCADPHDAGDLCTDEEFGEFELQLEYRMSKGGNSGVMLHVSDTGATTWATGPECQLLDNKDGADPNKAGWLYGFYTTDVDATKPAGEWNHLRLLITKERCAHWMNGVLYFEYTMHGDEWEQKLQKSKFARMPGFARFDRGRIALQGDHGLVSFRNLRIRPIEPK
ncbi:MAG: family 16 glycoside hydrolase [Planctomycetota bacterium]